MYMEYSTSVNLYVTQNVCIPVYIISYQQYKYIAMSAIIVAYVH